MSKNPVAYAENVLGVHAVHDEARDLAALLEHLYADMNGFAHQVRLAREELADREALVSIETRADHSQASATEFARIVKIAIQQDEECRSIRARILKSQQEHDRAESAASLAERRLKTAQARMIELGGVAAFYGLRSSRSNTSETSNQENQT